MSCPKGKILRKGYYRKNGTYVRPVCVPDKGLPGKTPANRQFIGKLKKEALGKYGYKNVSTMTKTARHTSLTKAVKAYGYASVVGKLNAVIVLNRNKPKMAKTVSAFREDMKWVQTNLRQYSKTYQKKSGAKSGAKSTKTGRKEKIKAGTKVVSGKSRQLWNGENNS